MDPQLTANNSFTTEPCLDCFSSTIAYPTWLLNAFYCIIFVLGVPANLAIVTAILFQLRLKSVTNIYICNMAAADLLFLAWIPFIVARAVAGQWLWGLLLCKLYFIGSSVNQFGSVAFLTALSLDRYLAICHPVKARSLRTTFVATIVSVTCWLVVALLMLPIYLYSTTVKVVPFILGEDNNDNNSMINSFDEDEYEKFQETQCLLLWPTDTFQQSRIAFTAYLGVLGFIGPLVLVWVLYGAALWTLVHRKRYLENCSCKQRSVRKVTIMVLSILLSYTLCWTPYWLVQLVVLVAEENTWMQSSKFRILSFAAYCLQSFNSVLNPILYCFGSGTYRLLFSRCFRRARTAIIVSSERSFSLSLSFGMFGTGTERLLRPRRKPTPSMLPLLSIRKLSTLSMIAVQYHRDRHRSLDMVKLQPGDVML